MRNAAWWIVLLLGSMSARVPGLDASLGVKAGVGFPFYSGNGYSSALGGVAHTRFRLGYSVGIASTFETAKSAIYQIEVLYTRVGGNWGDVYATHYDGAAIIDIPLTVGFKRRFRLGWLYPYAGIDLQLRVGESSYRIVDSDGYLVLTDTYQNSLLRPALPGGVLGLGVGAPLRGGRFVAEVRFCLGLFSRFTPDSAVRNWRQNDLQLLMGYQVPLKKPRRPELLAHLGDRAL